MRRLAVALLGLAILIVPAGVAQAAPRATDYAIIGDTPYGSTMLNMLPGRIGQINADPKVRLVVHLGDIKNGSSRCDTSYFNQIRSIFDGFADPLVYTPGDNEWTDCHRFAATLNPKPAQPVLDALPITNLALIRSKFFSAPVSQGKTTMPVMMPPGPVPAAL